MPAGVFDLDKVVCMCSTLAQCLVLLFFNGRMEVHACMTHLSFAGLADITPHHSIKLYM